MTQDSSEVRAELRSNFSDRIRALSRTNPIVHMGVSSYVNGIATKEQALTFMVEALALDVEQMSALLLKVMQRQPPAAIIVSMERPA